MTGTGLFVGETTSHFEDGYIKQPFHPLIKELERDGVIPPHYFAPPSAPDAKGYVDVYNYNTGANGAIRHEEGLGIIASAMHVKHRRSGAVQAYNDVVHDHREPTVSPKDIALRMREAIKIDDGSVTVVRLDRPWLGVAASTITHDVYGMERPEPVFYAENTPDAPGHSLGGDSVFFYTKNPAAALTIALKNPLLDIPHPQLVPFNDHVTLDLRQAKLLKQDLDPGEFSAYEFLLMGPLFHLNHNMAKAQKISGSLTNKQLDCLVSQKQFMKMEPLVAAAWLETNFVNVRNESLIVPKLVFDNPEIGFFTVPPRRFNADALDRADILEWMSKNASYFHWSQQTITELTAWSKQKEALENDHSHPCFTGLLQKQAARGR